MLACEPWPTKLGSGKKFSIAWPNGVMREDGITLPGNGALVLGSVIVINDPLFWKLCEKSPLRSKAVGVYLVWTLPLTNCPVYSCDQKKNSRRRSLLKWCGIVTGPPMV